jgi:CheY-like chemotaxis protein
LVKHPQEQEAATDLKFDLVVVDIAMPLNGLDACEQLKTLQPDTRVTS